jgi:prephenate dehydrogenase
LDPGPSRVAIVGRGLIGGSIELALAQRAPSIEVVALDRGEDLAAIAGADLVVLAAPVLENISLLRAIQPHLGPSTIVTDTGSTKAAIMEGAQGLRFVGGHPIAGVAGAGRTFARADLFAGRRWILTPGHSTPAADIKTVTVLAEWCGARVELLDAVDHDRIFALVSHLPQLAVSALMHVAGTHSGEEALALAGAGLRDATRLAASPPEIWRDVIATNRDSVSKALDLLIQALVEMRDDATGEALTRIFASAAASKRRLDDAPI